MKTKNNSPFTVNLKLFLVLPVFILLIFAFYSCTAKKKVPMVQSEIAPLPPPPPPPPPAIPESDPVYDEVDELPLFNNGDQGLLNFIAGNVNYPDEAKKNNIQGKVLVKFVVEKDCSVSKVEILQGVNPSLDAEALRVVNSLPKFEKPAIKAGVPVRVNYTIPIMFALK